MKPNISRGLDTSKMALTKAGQELSEALTFLAAIGEFVISAFSRKISFTDNIDSKFQEIELTNAVEFIVNTRSDSGQARIPIGIVPMQVVSSSYGIDSFQWYVDGSGQTKVKVGFTNSPAASTRIKVVLLIIYG